MGTYDWTANRLAPKSSTVGECTRRVSYRPEKGRYRIGYRRGANSDRLQPMGDGSPGRRSRRAPTLPIFMATATRRGGGPLGPHGALSVRGF